MTRAAAPLSVVAECASLGQSSAFETGASLWQGLSEGRLLNGVCVISAGLCHLKKMPLRCTLQRLSKKSGSDAFAAYSNPAAGAFTVNSISSGDFILYNAQHALIAKYPVVKSVNKLQLPATLAPGIYIGDYQATDGKSSQVIRLVYRP